jgi:hypothetical protein
MLWYQSRCVHEVIDSGAYNAANLPQLKTYGNANNVRRRLEDQSAFTARRTTTIVSEPMNAIAGWQRCSSGETIELYGLADLRL